MIRYSQALQRLVEELRRLPGVGTKSAQRLAFHLLKTSEQDALRLAQAIREVKERVRPCSVCHNVAESDPCPLCSDSRRDQSVICVVEEPSDMLAVERTGEYKGLYHVLGGALSPLDGVGPEELHCQSLLTRLGPEVQEVILATNPNVEGEATAMYLTRLIQPLGVRVSRIAHGLPVGGDLEYADEATMVRAMENRRVMGS